MRDTILGYVLFAFMFVAMGLSQLSVFSLKAKINRLEAEIATHEDYDYALGIVMSREDTGDGEYYYQICEYDNTDCGYFLSTQLFSVDELVLWIVKGDNIELVDLS